MASQSGRNAAPVSELLFEQPYRFDFFQAVRLLQRRAPERAAVGEQDDPRHEAVRFRSDVSLGFPASDLCALEDGGPDGTPVMTVAFLGLANPASFGSLPLHYTEWALEEETRNKNGAPRDFLDVFNHRLISLFYRAWEKYRFAVQYERRLDPLEGTFERALGAVAGLGTPALVGRLPLDDRTLLPWAGSLAGGPIRAAALEDLLQWYFGLPVQISQFVPEWYAVEPEDWSRLGQGCALGERAFLGSRVQLSQSRFRVRLGPLDWVQFLDLLPMGGAFERLAGLVQLAAGVEFEFDVQLLLHASEIPELQLGSEARDDSQRLGWSTWLCSEPATRDASDTIFRAEAHEHGAPGAASDLALVHGGGVP